MKALKIILIVLVSVFLILVVVGYMQPKEVEVSKSLVVKAPMCAVFDNVNDMSKRTLWSPWERADSTMQITPGEITIGQGAMYSWESAQSGNGSLTYTKVVENEVIETAMDFGEEGIATGAFAFEEVEDGTKVTWSFHADMGSNFFKRLMGGLMIKPMLEVSFTDGLKNLAEQAEADTDNPACHASSNAPSVSDMGEMLKETPQDGMESIVELNLPAVNYVSVIDSCEVAAMPEHMGKNYGILMGHMKQNNLAFHTAPMCIYHKYEPPTKVVFQPAMTVADAAAEAEGIVNGTMAEGMYVRATHIGSYEGMEPAWNALEAYIEANGLEVTGSPFEEYINDPGSTPEEELITHIYFPVRQAGA